ncbi:hypothetical protein MNBD_GAMMA02-1549 [hydrothermal vent metagenome]|uniref:Uncharacterized protein n=1 Tax=hydrothermal vent metagenome TaxID=652676 RepID=A0A3B0W9P2_9ZZZZ
MNKIILTVLLVSLPLMASANRYNNGNINYGQVVEVKPIYQLVSVPEERQVCDRRDNRYSNQRHDNHAGKAILGGIIGGAIGNRFGRGSGRDVSTALGVLIGAGVGANKGHHNNNRRNCYIETHYREEDRFMGYDVTYNYNGNLYHTQMQEHPGDRVRLRVNVDVVD